MWDRADSPQDTVQHWELLTCLILSHPNSIPLIPGTFPESRSRLKKNLTIYLENIYTWTSAQGRIHISFAKLMGGSQWEFLAPWFANRGLFPLSFRCNRGFGLWYLPSPPVGVAPRVSSALWEFWLKPKYLQSEGWALEKKTVQGPGVAERRG